MRCPFCGAVDTQVKDSRLSGEGDQVRRRRECPACNARFTTYESAELMMPRVVKGNGKREPFDERKLRTGVLRALEKRPVPVEAVDKALAQIKRNLMASGDKEVSSRGIGEMVMDALHDLDHVAYVRFASVYRDFRDTQAFRETIEHLERAPPAEARRRQLTLLDGK